MDLSKAFDCIWHHLLLVKLDAYSHESLCVIYSILDNKHQRVKINGSFNTYNRLYLGVLRGSFLGSLFFNTYTNDLLLSMLETYICNYAENTTT